MAADKHYNIRTNGGNSSPENVKSLVSSVWEILLKSLRNLYTMFEIQVFLERRMNSPYGLQRQLREKTVARLVSNASNQPQEHCFRLRAKAGSVRVFDSICSTVRSELPMMILCVHLVHCESSCIVCANHSCCTHCLACVQVFHKVVVTHLSH